MKDWSKRIWLLVALAVVVVAGVTAALMWDDARRGPPQIISMSGGDYRLAGVTYGTNHVMGSLAARLVHRLPASLEDFARNHFTKQLGPLVVYSTQVPSLCVWFKPLGTNATFNRGASGTRIAAALPLSRSGGSSNGTGYGIGISKLMDDHDVESGSRYLTALPRAGQPLGVFEVVPRRSPILQFSFSETDAQGMYREIGRVRFPNPLFGHFPVWQPEPVPAVKQAGDLEVQLHSFRSDFQPVWNPGYPFQVRGFTLLEITEGVETWFLVSISSTTGTNLGWLMQSATLSDPTGNSLASFSAANSWDENRLGLTSSDDKGKLWKFSGTLWPSEPAWRLKLEFKHTARFAPAELVTFTNVPVPVFGSRIGVPITKKVGGMEIVLSDFSRIPTVAYWGSIRHIRQTIVQGYVTGHPAGVNVELMKMVTDGGEEIPIVGNRWDPFSREAELAAIPTNARTVNITWAVQKMRVVEFFVKPPGR